MNINRMVVTYGGTINVGDYSNVKLEVTLEAALEAGDDYREARHALIERAKAEYVIEVCEYALRSQSALNYLAVIAPGTAEHIRERRKEATKADKS